MKKCKNCGKEFEPKNGNQKHCNRTCANDYKRQRYVKKGGYGKIQCPICQNEFVKQNRHIQYCSMECSRLASLKDKDIDPSIRGKERKNLRHKKYWKEWYHRNKENHDAHIKRVKKNNDIYKEKCKKYKESLNLKCIICGESENCCLDFHHLDPKNKEFNISKGITLGYKIERLKEEIEKCVCVCSNCHRKIHNGLINLNGA